MVIEQLDYLKEDVLMAQNRAHRIPSALLHTPAHTR